MVGAAGAPIPWRRGPRQREAQLDELCGRLLVAGQPPKVGDGHGHSRRHAKPACSQVVVGLRHRQQRRPLRRCWLRVPLRCGCVGHNCWLSPEPRAQLAMEDSELADRDSDVLLRHTNRSQHSPTVTTMDRLLQLEHEINDDSISAFPSRETGGPATPGTGFAAPGYVVADDLDVSKDMQRHQEVDARRKSIETGASAASTRMGESASPAEASNSQVLDPRGSDVAAAAALVAAEAEAAAAMEAELAEPSSTAAAEAEAGDEAVSAAPHPPAAAHALPSYTADDAPALPIAVSGPQRPVQRDTQPPSRTSTQRASLGRSRCFRDLETVGSGAMNCGAEAELDKQIADYCDGQMVLQATDKNLWRATVEGVPLVVRRLIDGGASVNAPFRNVDNVDTADKYVTLLHLVSSRPDMPHSCEILSEIIRGKANLNARSSVGATPLARACYHKHMGAVVLLLANGADPKPMDDKGRNALVCAMMLREEPEVSVDIGIRSGNSVTKLSLPIIPIKSRETIKEDKKVVAPNNEERRRREELSGQLVDLLASHGVDMNKGSPLLVAIKQANRTGVAKLLSQGAKPEFLHVAVDAAPISIIEDILRAKANPSEEDADGRTVWEIAFARDDEEITTLLRDTIGDFERQNANQPKPAPPPELELTPRFSLQSKSNGGDRKRVKRVRISSSRSATSTTSGGDDAKVRDDDEDSDLGLGFSPKTRPQVPRRNSNKHPNSKQVGPLVSPREEDEEADHEAGDLFDRLKEGFWDLLARLSPLARRLNRNKYFQQVMFTALLLVLYLPDLWILADMESNDGLDAVLVVIFLAFFMDLMVQTVGTPRSYINSFFFWMDVVGLLSVPLDHSMVSLPRHLDNTVVMRAARMARLGARAGRFTKLVKLLRFLPGVAQEVGSHTGTARLMSHKLMLSLSTRVSCLIILMVMVLPLFDMATFPENDFSMKTWMNTLYFTLQNHPNTMQERIDAFSSFYGTKDYFPFEVTWDSNGTQTTQRLQGERPRRAANELEIYADSEVVKALFNFGKQNRTDATMNMCLITVIIFLMMGFALLLSNSVSAIVLQPLENLLQGVHQMAAKIFNSVSSIVPQQKEGEVESEHDFEEPSAQDEETQLLEKVIRKLAALSALTTRTPTVNADAEAIMELLGEQTTPASSTPAGYRVPAFLAAYADNAVDLRGEDPSAELVQILEHHFDEANMTWAAVDSWDFDAWSLDERQRRLVCLCFLIFHLGVNYTSSQRQHLASFVEACANGYLPSSKVAYHNWIHAMDVTHTMFRLLGLCGAEQFLGGYERFALVVSAVCHDIGHPGLNNPFLVETSHELAIRYNDRSPLENMHCARLFEIVSQPHTAVFAKLDNAQYQEARQVCIEAILHTDNIYHFPMAKDLQMLYEMHSDVFDIALQMHQARAAEFPPKEISEIFEKPDTRKTVRNLFLHASDISNPWKPFPICQKWAWMIIDEFFMQGDKEKELGITVQPLNDRDKVNCPYSQVGFIEFFVAPFAFAAARILPPMVSCTVQMMTNIRRWCDEWVDTTVPPPDSEEVVKLRDRLAKLEAKYVFREGF